MTALFLLLVKLGKAGKLASIGGKTGTIVRGAVAGGAADVIKESTYTKDSLTQKTFKAAGIDFGENAATRTLI